MNFWRNLHPLLRRDKNNDYGSANYAVLSSLADSLSDAEQETIQNKSQLILKTASGLYLDEWGSWFGVTRKPKETDDDYRERIMWYLLVPRSTIEGIITGIKYYLDDNDAKISVYEPWKNIFYTNKSSLNGPDHLQGLYYRFAVIDVRIDRPMSKAIYDAIMAFKPAGVKFYVTIDETLASDQDQLVLADVQSKNWFELEQYVGFYWKHNTIATFADFNHSQSPVKQSDLFTTNDSHLDGPDVLAGSAMHNLVYWNSLTHLGTIDSKSVDQYRGIISTLSSTYMRLSPDNNGVVLTGSMSLLNQLQTNEHAILDNLVTGVTNYEKVKAYCNLAGNNKGKLGIYILFDGSNNVTVNGQKVEPGFNDLGFDDITYTQDDIAVNIVVKSEKMVRLRYIGIVLKSSVDKSFTGQGVQVKSEMLAEAIDSGVNPVVGTAIVGKAKVR